MGVRPTPIVEEEPQNNVQQEEITVKNKKCAECGKKFVNGTNRKSKYLACISCDRLTHENMEKIKRHPSDVFIANLLVKIISTQVI